MEGIKMEDLFFESNSSFEGSMMHINTYLESAILTYTEDLLTNHFVTESVKESLWSKLKQFFAKLILSLKSFTKELQTKIDYVIKEKQIHAKLNQLHKELKEKQSINKTVEMVDYWEMRRIFNKYYNVLSNYAKKFSKVKYTKTWQIEDDLDAFNKLLEKCNAELEEVSSKKIKVSITKALNFVEDEIRGKSEVFKSLNDSMRDFSEIEQIAEGLKTRMNILGAEVIPKHVSFIQRMVNAISGFVRKWTVKIIMGIVFIFTF
jgi:hypothetical protein